MPDARMDFARKLIADDPNIDDATLAAALKVFDTRQAPAQKPARTWTDTAVDALPAIGGALGGIVGGIGGTAFGLGVGGVPGGIGGAAAGGAAGEAARQLVNRARGADAPATAGQAALDIGVEGGLQGAAQLAGGLIGRGASAVAKSVAPALMQSALKPGIRSTLAAAKTGTVPPVVRTLLNEGVNVTPGGIEKLNRVISASNTEIADALAQVPSSARVQPLAVTRRLTDTARKFGNQVNPQSDLDAISTVGENFLDAHGNPLTVAQAQALKTGTYEALSSKAYGEMKGATIEAEKALARGLKEEIADEARKAGIDLNALNAREGAAITARDEIAKRVALAKNRDPGGLAWLAHSPMTFLAAITGRDPATKSMIARGLWKAASVRSGVPVDVLKFAIGSIASSVHQEPE